MKAGYKRNKLHQLTLFCAVIEEGTILKASEKMNTAQPNVSLQIRSLEKSLKVVLFKREKQRLIPTPEAVRFYKMCKKSIEEMDFLLNNAMEVIKEDSGNLIKISAHSYMFSHILPPFFKEVIEVNPKVTFELYNLNYTEGLDMLEAGTVDFAIYPAVKENLSKNIELQEFYKCKFGICVSKEHPLAQVSEEDITWEMLAKHDYITLGRGATVQNAKSIIEEYGINSRFKLYNGTWEIGMGLIKQGLTIAGADTLYGEWHDDVVIKKCYNLIPNYTFHILSNKENIISQTAERLLDIILPKEV